MRLVLHTQKTSGPFAKHTQINVKLGVDTQRCVTFSFRVLIFSFGGPTLTKNKCRNYAIRDTALLLSIYGALLAVQYKQQSVSAYGDARCCSCCSSEVIGCAVAGCR